MKAFPLNAASPTTILTLNCLDEEAVMDCLLMQQDRVWDVLPSLPRLALSQGDLWSCK